MFEVGQWVWDGDGYLIGKVVEVRQPFAGGTDYVVSAPKVKVEASNLHLVPGEYLEATDVEDSHFHMAVDLFMFLCDELIAAGRADEAEEVWALALKFAGPGAGDDICPGCGSSSHPVDACPEFVPGVVGDKE